MHGTQKTSCQCGAKMNLIAERCLSDYKAISSAAKQMALVYMLCIKVVTNPLCNFDCTLSAAEMYCSKTIVFTCLWVWVQVWLHM